MVYFIETMVSIYFIEKVRASEPQSLRASEKVRDEGLRVGEPSWRGSRTWDWTPS